MRNKIRLDTLSDVHKFVAITEKFDSSYVIKVTDTNRDFVVNGKSAMGLAYGATEFGDLWVECNKDIYSQIKEFLIEASAE